jgi:hypothetical protein
MILLTGKVARSGIETEETATSRFSYTGGE